MSEQVPVDPFLQFMERFRIAMAGRLHGLLPHYLVFESVDRIIWHALTDDKQQHSYLVLQSTFESMGVSQEQKNRFIQHAGWANYMWHQRDVYQNLAENDGLPRTQPNHYSNSLNETQVDFRRPGPIENYTSPYASPTESNGSLPLPSVHVQPLQQQHENVQPKELGPPINTALQLNNNDFDKGEDSKHIHGPVKVPVGGMDSSKTSSATSSTIQSPPMESSLPMEKDTREGLERTRETKQRSHRGIINKPRHSLTSRKKLGPKAFSNFIQRGGSYGVLEKAKYAKRQKYRALQQQQKLPNDFPHFIEATALKPSLSNSMVPKSLHVPERNSISNHHDTEESLPLSPLSVFIAENTTFNEDRPYLDCL
ncbi:hypothetical protein NHQ30_010438 [Ciborinia camelliae]|nr:hypothetical protein NHQ30_010438 [Ciborinia camelliae]